jgi:predicted O-methyltransferase YrrM
MPDGDQRWSAVDDYISDHLIGEDAIQQETLEANRKAGLPAIDVSAAQGKMLQLLAKGVGAKRILEIGTLGGYSTIWLARALPENGIVVTLELEESYAQIARTNISKTGLDDKVEIIVGEAIATLSALVHKGTDPFDFVFIDADKQNYAPYLEHAIRLSRPGAMLLFDNVVRKGRYLIAIAMTLKFLVQGHCMKCSIITPKLMPLQFKPLVQKNGMVFCLPLPANWIL